MSLELMIRANSPDDLRKQLADLLGTAAAPLVAVGAGAASGATTTARTAKPKDEPKDVAPVVQPEPEPITEVSEEACAQVADEPKGVLTYDGDIKPAVLKVSGKHGRPGVEKLLADFGVDHTSKVPEEKWPEFLAAIDKMLGG